MGFWRQVPKCGSAVPFGLFSKRVIAQVEKDAQNSSFRPRGNGRSCQGRVGGRGPLSKVGGAGAGTPPGRREAVTGLPLGSKCSRARPSHSSHVCPSHRGSPLACLPPTGQPFRASYLQSASHGAETQAYAPGLPAGLVGEHLASAEGHYTAPRTG